MRPFRSLSQPASLEATEREAWPDLPIPVGASFPRISSGLYEARSADLKTFVVFRRRCLSIYFDVYANDERRVLPVGFAGGVVLARLPMFFRLPPNGHRLRPSSKLARLFDLVGYQGRRDRLPMNLLRNKLWRVEVGDVPVGSDHDDAGRPRPLAEAQRYSVIRAVVERLA